MNGVNDANDEMWCCYVNEEKCLCVEMCVGMFRDIWDSAWRIRFRVIFGYEDFYVRHENEKLFWLW